MPNKTFHDETITVVGKETVAGTEAWRVDVRQILVPEGGNPNTPGAVSTFDPHTSEKWWFRVSDGLPLRLDRVTNSVTIPMIGPKSTYVEEGSMTIVL